MPAKKRKAEATGEIERAVGQREVVTMRNLGKVTKIKTETSAKKRKTEATGEIERAVGQRELVTSLMRNLGKVTRTKTDKRGENLTKEYTKWECPKPGCSKVVEVLLGSGFTNPYRHLEKHYSAAELTAMHKGAAVTVDSSFAASSVSPRGKCIFAFLEIVVMKNLPLDIVEDELFRKFHDCDCNISVKTFKRVIIQLVELVEQRIATEMKSSPVGALMHGGWTCRGIHYAGVFACYCHQVDAKVRNGLNGEMEEVPKLTLLSVSPMAQIQDETESEDDDEENDSIAAQFTAEAHVTYFKSVLSYYGLTLDWVVASIADNATTNVKIAGLLGVPHVGCNSHKLNLEVERMVNNNGQLCATIDSCHNTMRGAKASIKNRALLLNLTPLVPVVHNATRWSGKYNILKRFAALRGSLINVSEEEESKLPIDRSEQFLAKVNKFTGQLGAINDVTKFLQNRGQTLQQARLALDVLSKNVQDHRREDGHPLHLCSLGTHYIAPDAQIVRDKHFESGVVKIQRKELKYLTVEEKKSVRRLRKPQPEGEGTCEVPAYGLSIIEQIERRNNAQQSGKSDYFNCDFIFGSVAEVERLRSLSKHILANARKSMTPIMFESLIFLKANRRLWDDALVSEAVEMARTEAVEKRMQLDEEQETLLIDG